MTLLAYIIVIFFGWLSLTVAFLLCGAVVSAVLFWVPGKIGGLLRTIPSAVVGGFFAVGFGYVVFKWLVGPGAFGLLPLLATIIPLGIPLTQDYKKYQQLRQNVVGSDEAIKAAVAPLIAISGAAALGEVVGVLAGAIWFFGK